MPGRATPTFVGDDAATPTSEPQSSNSSSSQIEPSFASEVEPALKGTTFPTGSPEPSLIESDEEPRSSNSSFTDPIFSLSAALTDLQSRKLTDSIVPSADGYQIVRPHSTVWKGMMQGAVATVNVIQIPVLILLTFSWTNPNTGCCEALP